jgi:hypothetical protein
MLPFFMLFRTVKWLDKYFFHPLPKSTKLNSNLFTHHYQSP